MTMPIEDEKTQIAAAPGSAGPKNPVDGEAPRKKGRRKRALILVAIVLAVPLAIYGIRYLIWSLGHEETDDAYLAGHLHPISARIADTVQEVLVDDNQHVSQGETLVILDPKDFQVRLDQAKAALDEASRQAETAQATIHSTSQTATAQTVRADGAIGEAKASIAAQKAEVAAAQAAVPSAEAKLQETVATLKREEVDLHRYEDLEAKDEVSRQTLDHARASYQVAVAARDAAEQQVREARARLLQAQEGVTRTEAMLTSSYAIMESAKAASLDTKVRQAQFTTAQAAISRAAAALEDARLQLSYTVIKAPASGRVGRKSVEVGQRLQVGQPLLAIVEDDLWVVANFKETQLEKMRPKQAVDLEIDSFPNHAFRGHVDSIAPGSGNQFALLPPDNATGNFTKIVQRIPVKILFDPDSVKGYENLLAPGMSAVVTVTTR
jgi:membrane fusion protein, multidrug efflux system